ncbi:MAG TPA: DUF3618 domain-containing protein [Mycobacteriales bacterium]|nr:DUF3618 domain-containing protein [Mycobacteriales bacterium]
MTRAAPGGRMPAPVGSHRGIDGGDVAQQNDTQRDPDTIQKEIEQTRAELADTIDAIAERISPKRAASRGANAVKSSVSGLFGSNGNGHAPASVLDAGAAQSGEVDTAARRRAVQAIAREGGGAAYTGTSEFTVERRLRAERVLLVVGAAAALAGAVVLWRSRRR